MSGAKALAGADVLVPEEDLKPLADDTYYHHQLLGCMVVTAGGLEVGPVADILSAGASDLLVIKPAGRGEILIPCSREICLEVNLRSRVIVIDPPDGLLDLNEI